MPDASSAARSSGRPSFSSRPRLSYGYGLSLLLGALTCASCGPDHSVNRAVSVGIGGPSEDAGADRRASGQPGGETRGADAAPVTGPLDPLPPDARPAAPIDARAPTPPPAPAIDARAPAPPTTVPPDAAASAAEQLEVTRSNPGATVTNLTDEGTLDWLHVGFQSTDAVNRKKSNATPLLLMNALGTTPVAARSSGDFSKFLWDDGTPVSSARNVQSGFETATLMGAGFQIVVQGDPARARVVKLYVGSQQGRAKVTARFGSFGMPGYVDRLGDTDTERNRLYTITFRPANAERALILEWTIDGAMGSVRLQAVTLSEPARSRAPDAGR